MLKSCYGLLTFIFFLHFSTSLYSQTGLRGSKFSELGIGFRGAGLHASGYAGKLLSPTIRMAGGGGFGYSNLADIKYKYVFVDALGIFNLKSFRKVLFNASAGVSINGDLINDFQTDQTDKQFSLNYGVLGGIESEFQMTKQMYFVLNAQQRYYIKSDYGNWRYQFGASIRFMF